MAAASYATSMLTFLLWLVILINRSAAGTGGFSLPVVSSHHGLTYSADGFFVQQEQLGGANLTTIRPPMAQYGWSHAVQVGVGTGQGRNLYMLELDLTGDVTWMQCRPSDPQLQQASPIFDTSMSHSYSNVGPRSPICKDPYTPEGRNKCSFQLLFHGTFARGYLGTDDFSFASSSSSSGGSNAETIRGIVFGCAHKTQGFLNHGTLAGALSMSRHPTSLMKQLTNHGVGQFSYCLAAGGNSRGFLRFGGDVTHPSGARRTAIMYHGTLQREYRIRVTGVILDGRKLIDITPGMFRGSFGARGGCVIDVGASVSKMIHEAYQILENEVADHLQSHGAHRVTVLYQGLCILATPDI
ncbi:hypothetical protein PR202_ga28848 [Eleusine coracana subsp. coracana]|uniref:Peptidase A1 domain-containing protein n=1 Tax=Eleusine coracana subsp. coracana TaxID=191504 RepID=A0AAV5DJV4_ELECO|nr:hypothetical protein PR202_ga28848 [Eleusine coracana subsp. coracana]